MRSTLSALTLPGLTLLAALPLLACDEVGEPTDAELEALDDELDPAREGLDPELLALEGVVAMDPSERDEFELLGPDEDEQTVACGLGLPTKVFAGPSLQRSVHGTISAIAQGMYFFDAVRPTFPYLSNWTIKIGQAVVARLNQPSQFFFASDGTGFDVVMQAPPGATPGMSYDLEVRLYNNLSQRLCTDTVTLEIADCGQVGWWASGPWPTPTYDGANCHVAYLPPGVQSFVWSNNWYVVPTNGNQCSIGVFDGANCYIGSAGGGRTAFFYGGAMYYTL